MDCKKITEQELIKMMKSEAETDVTQAIHCFNHLYYNEFLKVSWNVVFHNRNYAKQFREQLERDAFNDALNEFYFFVRNGEYEKREATLQTVFLSFCKYKLLGRIKAEERNMKKEVKGNADDIFESGIFPYASWEETKEQMIKDDEQNYIIHQAWLQLGERCRNLLLWRKVHKLSNEEIQSRTGISENVVNNEVYRCFVRLKNKCREIRV
jgi:RNA polymerase sigma factor (sigma-70 family)